MIRRLLKYLVRASIAFTLLTSAFAKNVLIEDAKKTVVFVFAMDTARQLEPLGTGFLAGVKSTVSADQYFLYLVTAKHVLSDGAGGYRKDAFVRLNKRDGGSEFLRLDTIIGGKEAVFTNPTESLVDIVVVPVFLDVKKFDLKFIQDELILTTDEFKRLEISEGSDVFFTGLFLPFLGSGRNYPVVRSGKVALVSEEKIPWRTDSQKAVEFRELYLGETQSYGGNSGSPVYVLAPSTTEVNRMEMRLLGVMMGTFEQGSPVAVIENLSTAVSKQNLGIAAVVPAHLLHDILFDPELATFRQGLETNQTPKAKP